MADQHIYQPGEDGHCVANVQRADVPFGHISCGYPMASPCHISIPPAESRESEATPDTTTEEHTHTCWLGNHHDHGWTCICGCGERFNSGWSEDAQAHTTTSETTHSMDEVCQRPTCTVCVWRGVNSCYVNSNYR